MTTPFELPPIVITPYDKEALLVLLREHCSQHEMPSATSQHYTSKPEYLENPNRLTMPEALSFGASGKYQLANDPYSFSYGHTFVCLMLSQVDILVDLVTEEAWCRLSGERTWLAWEPGESVAILPKELEEAIDIYA